MHKPSASRVPTNIVGRLTRHGQWAVGDNWQREGMGVENLGGEWTWEEEGTKGARDPNYLGSRYLFIYSISITTSPRKRARSDVDRHGRYGGARRKINR